MQDLSTVISERRFVRCCGHLDRTLFHHGPTPWDSDSGPSQSTSEDGSAQRASTASMMGRAIDRVLGMLVPVDISSGPGS